MVPRYDARRIDETPSLIRIGIDILRFHGEGDVDPADIGHGCGLCSRTIIISQQGDVQGVVDDPDGPCLCRNVAQESVAAPVIRFTGDVLVGRIVAVANNLIGVVAQDAVAIAARANIHFDAY